MPSDPSPTDPTPPTAGKPSKLSASEASQLATVLADLTKLGLPLASGLRALAEETPGTPLAGALIVLAQQIEQGVPLEEAVGKLDARFPPHVKGLISVGLRSGNLGETLSEFAAQQRTIRSVRRQVWQALMYPLFLLLFSLPILGFLLFVLLPMMRETVLTTQDWYEPETILPPLTQFLFQIVDQGPILGLIVLVGAGVSLLLGMVIGGTRFLDAVICSMPLLGATIVWSRVANFSHVLGTMLKHQVPLPEALRYTSEAVPGAGLRAESRQLAETVARGATFSAAVEQTGQFPALLPAFIAWGERSNSVPEALDAAGQYAGQQVEIHSERIRLIVPVIVFTSVAFIVGLIVLAIMIPMVRLIGGLTG